MGFSQVLAFVVLILCLFGFERYAEGNKDPKLNHPKLNATGKSFHFGARPPEKFELEEGLCRMAKYKELVFHETKSFIPLFSDTTTVSHYGDKKIYCVRVADLLGNKETGSEVKITKGGFGHYFVELEIRPSRIYNIAFEIFVYARDEKNFIL